MAISELEAGRATRERRCARTRKGKALLVIDRILGDIEPEGPLLGQIYKIAHCATGVCLNPHEDWVEELNNLYEKLKEE